MTDSVLVVDDAVTIRMYHCGIISAGGFNVEQAANGLEALEAGRERRFGLFVVDVNMPRMDGYTLVEALRRDGPNTETPVLMVSTEAGHADAERAYASGANVYLTKPVTGEELLELVSLLITKDE